MAEPAPPADHGLEPHGAVPESSALSPALELARAQNLPARDPMRWRRIDALAQRAAHHTGATRQLLEVRLHALLAESAQAEAAAPSPTQAHAATETRPLRALLAQLQHAATASDAPRHAAISPPPQDLKVVHQHRAAWTQLRAEQRVAQSQTALPGQAGPLNSQLLLYQALTLMRETAPGYLQHLTGQAEALMWLEQALAAPSADPKATARGKAATSAAKAPVRKRAAAPSGGRSARR